MRISRLYLSAALSNGALVPLEDAAAHYLKTVLRLKKGHQLTVFQGDGREWPATVEALGREGVLLQLGESLLPLRESPLKTHLALGISRSEKMDLALQKAVELGVTMITPLETDHCVVRLDDSKRISRHQHWLRVAISACEQSGRNVVPRIENPRPFYEWLEESEGSRLILDPKGFRRLDQVAPPTDGITFISGPEGGFSEEERATAIQKGCLPIRLGPRILRTETAVLAILSAAQILWGDWQH